MRGRWRRRGTRRLLVRRCGGSGGVAADGYACLFGEACGGAGSAGLAVDESKAHVGAELDHGRVAAEARRPVEGAAGPPVRRVLLLDDARGELAGDRGPVGGVLVGASRAGAVHDDQRPARGEGLVVGVVERRPHHVGGGPVAATCDEDSERGRHGASRSVRAASRMAAARLAGLSWTGCPASMRAASCSTRASAATAGLKAGRAVGPRSAARRMRRSMARTSAALYPPWLPPPRGRVTVYWSWNGSTVTASPVRWATSAACWRSPSRVWSPSAA